MNKLKHLVYLTLIFMTGNIIAQDSYRYTFFDMTQVALNPALSGGFEGTARIGGLFREQDFGLQVGQYRSPVLFVDAPLIRGLRKQDWIGFGISMQYDEQAIVAVGESSFLNKMVKTTTIGGFSYHLALDKKRKNVLSFGLQSANANISFKDSRLILSEDIQNYIDNPGTTLAQDHSDLLPNGQNKKSVNLGWTLGTVLTSNISETSKFQIGVAVSNISFKKYNSFSILQGSGSSIYKLPLRFSAFGVYKMELANGLILQPRVFFQYKQPSLEASAQILAGMKIKKPKEMILSAGLGFNPANGLQFLLSSDIKDLRIVYSFDLNLSQKTVVSGPAGAFELGVYYTIKVYKKPKPDPVLLCPQI